MKPDKLTNYEHGPAHRVSPHFDPMGVVNQRVEDAVGYDPGRYFSFITKPNTMSPAATTRYWLPSSS